MSVPPYPHREQYGPSGGPWSLAQPGPIPLRPLGVGEILGVAVTVVRRSFVPLAVAALIVAALSTLATMAALAITGSLQSYAEGTWATELMAGVKPIPTAIVVAAVAGLVISQVGAPVVAGMAAAYAGAAALGRSSRGALSERLRGRWTILLGVAAVVGLTVSVGMMLLVVPGVIAFLVLALAAPVAVMERSGLSPSLRRSSLLTRGHRGRIFGAVLLSLVIGTLVSAVVTTVAGALVGDPSSVTALVISQTVAVVVSAFTGAWSGAVVAVLYIDIRIRAEHLDQALRMAAAADRNRLSPPDPAAP